MSRLGGVPSRPGTLPRLVVAATHSGAGKTTLATGLMAALRARGLRVGGFKVGPDFIDPGYHALATGRPGRNLDAVLSGSGLLAPLLVHGARGADVAVIEGVMGLFDGADRVPDGEDAAAAPGDFASTAHVAALLGAPVILVVDAAGLSRSVAALVHGYVTFDRRVRVAGVVANRVGSQRHAQLLRSALHGCGVPLLGALRRDDAVAVPSRHLGLVPTAERSAAARAAVAAAGALVARDVDLDAVLRAAAAAAPLRAPAWTPPQPPPPSPPAVVAVAGGPAFSFRYTENLELLEAAGAQLAFFDPTADSALPAGTAALYLGGGFPEEHAAALAANVPLRRAVAAFVRAGGPVEAECGGLLYLCRSLDGQPQCGVLGADAAMTSRLVLGYRRARVATPVPWWPAGTVVAGHEFHRTALTPAAGAQPAWLRDGRPEGFVTAGVHASYLHSHWAATPQVAAALVAAARTGPRPDRASARRQVPACG